MSKSYLTRAEFNEAAAQSAGGLTRRVPHAKEVIGKDEKGKDIYQKYQLKKLNF